MMQESELYYFSGKRQHNSDLVDRISDLPDCILNAILSLLPTKEAVSTILLSKRWKFVWRTVHNLHFYHSRPSRPNHKDVDIKFIEFVNRVLHLHDDRTLPNKFSIYWNYSDRISSSLANSWINTAIIRNVHNLSLNSFEPYALPTSAFSCDSLRSLTLSGRLFYVPETLEVFLPRLESLNMHNIEFESEAACEIPINGCPMLSKLYLRIVNNDDFKCIISSASLRRLTLYFSKKSSFKLNASSIEYLSLHGDIHEILIEKSLTSLVEADLDLLVDDTEFSYNSIVKALRVFDSAKVLTLSTDAIKALECATIGLSTEFKRLVKLKATTCRSLQDFICNSDNLQVLEIEQDIDEMYYYHMPLEWSLLVEVPRCLSHSLKKVKLYYYECEGVDLELIWFILEHGSALETVEIFCDDKIYELAIQIFEFPRISPVCIVHVSKW